LSQSILSVVFVKLIELNDRFSFHRFFCIVHFLFVIVRVFVFVIKNSTKLQKNASTAVTAQKDKEASIIIDDEDKDSDDDKKEMDDAEKSMETKSIVELNKLDKNNTQNALRQGSYLRDALNNTKRFSKDAPFKAASIFQSQKNEK
jgi:lipopolysaccharide export LptBFGC system permease protein LptF